MNVASFFERWAISENPFRAEEARHDPVFARLGHGPTTHPDFEKILGDLSRPSSAIVFGEKGSGKTAIRMQAASRIEAYNRDHPDAKVLLVAYDDLNPILDRFASRSKVDGPGEPKGILKVLKRLRLVDHMDAVLHLATARVVDMVLGEEGRSPRGAGSAARMLRRAPEIVRGDLAVLAAVYDREEQAPARFARLRRLIRAPGHTGRWLWRALAYAGWVIPALVLGLFLWLAPETLRTALGLYTLAGAGAVWLIGIAKRAGWDRFAALRLARRVTRQTRAVPRRTGTVAGCLDALPNELRRGTVLPIDDADDTRYALLNRLRRVLGAIGYAGMVVVIDRLDEPTLISGDPERMRAVVWPLLNNKLLQQDGLGIKLLLPIELRYELLRESTAFFQEARLDKQNLIERLVWTGSTLFDLCTARLNACRGPG
ncbi:MAG TPA: hypothetical protein DEB06_11020, partial [Phycisphaerales bacterium]|nr:hypothetical protein [Phycisphaerales bacterium]